MLRARHLKMVYDGRTVLDVDHFELAPGDVVALLGPNGSGKTTFLETLAFLRRPTAGTVSLDAELPGSQRDRAAFRRRVTLVEQYPILFTSTVLGNVAYPLAIRGVESAERRRRAAELLAMVGLSTRADDRAGRLSGGQTRRAAIARALACDPEVLLLDEPTSNVDAENRAVIEGLIGRISRDRGIPIVFSTHSMIQAGRLSARSLFLYEGRVSSSAHENIFTASVEDDDTDASVCVLPGGLRLVADAATAAGSVRVSVGPEGLSLAANGAAEGRTTVLPGKLYQIVDDGNRVRLRVDVGVPLGLMIDKAIFRGLGVTVGDAVWLRVPPESLRIYPVDS